MVGTVDVFEDPGEYDVSDLNILNLLSRRLFHERCTVVDVILLAVDKPPSTCMFLPPVNSLLFPKLHSVCECSSPLPSPSLLRHLKRRLQLF